MLDVIQTQVAHLPQWMFGSGLALSGVIIGLLIGRVLMTVATWLVSAQPKLFSQIELKRLREPFYTVIPILSLFLTLRLGAPWAIKEPVVNGAAKIAIVGLVYWFALRLIDIISLAVERRYNFTTKTNIEARQLRTQISVVRSLATFLVFIIALVAIFLMFDTLRTLGVSILASAGVAGIVIGVAAQKTLGNLFAGVQIALAQPIRLEDVVVVEGEWGWVEEIRLTYVVVRLWDLRRLVLPIGYFIEKPFTNWTKSSSALIGTVVLCVDFTLPLQPLRDELNRLLSVTPLWDGKTQVVQVIDCDDKTMRLRILVSGADSAATGDLCNFVRENLIAFVVREYPDALPHGRSQLRTDEPSLPARQRPS